MTDANGRAIAAEPVAEVHGGVDASTRLFLSADELLNPGALSQKGLDVLHVVGGAKAPWPLPDWFLEKTSRWARRLTELGVNARAAVVSAISRAVPEHVFDELLVALHPKLVISRAFSLPPERIVSLAVCRPTTRFLQVNHTPNSFTLFPASRGALASAKAIADAKAFENIYYGVVSLRDWAFLRKLHPSPRIMYTPNPCFNADFTCYRSGTLEPPVDVAIAGRANLQKNFKNQIDAVAVFARKHKTRLHLVVGREHLIGLGSEIRGYATALASSVGFETKVFSFITPGEFIGYVRETVDLLVHATFDESFGYLPWEAGAAGIPVVGSSAVPFAPIIANPIDVLDIASCIERIVADYGAYSRQARESALEVGRRQDQDFCSALSRLMDRSLAAGDLPGGVTLESKCE